MKKQNQVEAFTADLKRILKKYNITIPTGMWRITLIAQSPRGDSPARASAQFITDDIARHGSCYVSVDIPGESCQGSCKAHCHKGE